MHDKEAFVVVNSDVHCFMLMNWGSGPTKIWARDTVFGVWAYVTDLFLISVGGGSYNCHPPFTVGGTMTGGNLCVASEFASWGAGICTWVFRLHVQHSLYPVHLSLWVLLPWSQSVMHRERFHYIPGDTLKVGSSYPLSLRVNWEHCLFRKENVLPKIVLISCLK